MQIGPSLSLSGGRASTAPFSPASIPGLQLWLDAASSPLWQDAAGTVPAVADSDPVRRWDDLSGAGRSLTAANDAARPTLRLGVKSGLPAVRCDGVDDVVSGGTPVIAQPYTLLLVVTGGEAAAVPAGGGSGYGYMHWTAAGYMRVYAGTSAALGDTPTSGWHLLTAAVAGAATVCRRNGVAYPTVNAGTVALTGFQVGKDPYAAAYAGDVAEILLYSGALSGANLSTLEGYLNAKWGVY